MPRNAKNKINRQVKGNANVKGNVKGNGTVTNPLTGRQIKVGGAVYRRVSALVNQIGGNGEPKTDVKVPLFSTDVLKQQSEKFFDQLTTKASPKPIPTKLAATSEDGSPVIPKNKNALIGSNLPPAPPQTHSYYHHHAPFAQDFGSYVCLKKDTLRDLGMFLRDTMFASTK